MTLTKDVISPVEIERLRSLYRQKYAAHEQNKTVQAITVSNYGDSCNIPLFKFMNYELR